MKVLNIDKVNDFAYKKYGWSNNISGIEISNLVVGEALKSKSNVFLYLPSDYALYQISPDKVIKLAKAYNSIVNKRNGSRVAVIPVNALIVVQGLSNEVKLEESPPMRTMAQDNSVTIKECQAKIERMKQDMIDKRKRQISFLPGDI